MSLIESIRQRFSFSSHGTYSANTCEIQFHRRPLTFLKSSGAKRPRSGLISKSAQSSTVSTATHLLRHGPQRRGEVIDEDDSMTADQMLRCMRYAVGDILWAEANVIEPGVRDIASIEALSLAILMRRTGS